MAVRKVPKKYTSGLSKSTAAKRKAEIRKRATGKKKSFKPLPGDSKETKRKSKYTGRVTRSGVRKAIFAEATKGKGKQEDRFIKAVAKVTDVPSNIIREVYKKGLAAWAVGHRPGATQFQWARARVYSFITKGKTTKTADASLYLEAKKALKKKNSSYNL